MAKIPKTFVRHTGVEEEAQQYSFCPQKRKAAQ